MNTETFRESVQARLAELRITPFRAAGLTGVNRQVIYDFLAGGEIGIDRAFSLAKGIGLTISVSPDPEFSPPPARKRSPK